MRDCRHRRLARERSDSRERVEDLESAVRSAPFRFRLGLGAVTSESSASRGTQVPTPWNSGSPPLAFAPGWGVLARNARRPPVMAHCVKSTAAQICAVLDAELPRTFRFLVNRMPWGSPDGI